MASRSEGERGTAAGPHGLALRLGERSSTAGRCRICGGPIGLDAWTRRAKPVNELVAGTSSTPRTRRSGGAARAACHGCCHDPPFAGTLVFPAHSTDSRAGRQGGAGGQQGPSPCRFHVKTAGGCPEPAGAAERPKTRAACHENVSRGPRDTRVPHVRRDVCFAVRVRAATPRPRPRGRAGRTVAALLFCGTGRRRSMRRLLFVSTPTDLRGGRPRSPGLRCEPARTGDHRRYDAREARRRQADRLVGAPRPVERAQDARAGRGAPTHTARDACRGATRRCRGLEQAFLCVHSFEGSWSDPDPPYWGGLQMDWSFMSTYGAPFLRAFGPASNWTPAMQIAAAERAYLEGRRWGPWPNTSRMCGLT